MKSTKEIDEKWKIIHPDSDIQVFKLYDKSHPLPLYLGKDIKNEKLLLLATKEKVQINSGLKSISIDCFERENGEWAIILNLKDESLSEMFSILCIDLIESSRHLNNDSKAIRFFLTRINHWKKLLRDGPDFLMNENLIRGLFGELIYLKSKLIPLIGKLESFKSWNGPNGSDQDFQIFDKAWEIKTIQPEATSLLISSEDQLYSKSREIRLVVIFLNELSSSRDDFISLNTLISSIRKDISDNFEISEIFENQLSLTNYITRSEYDTPLFRVDKISEYLIDENFPRLTKENIPKGISKVKYQISLSMLNEIK